MRKVTNLFFLILLWLPVLEILELEWRFNEQYHYGYFVPIFALYLIYNRWIDRPPCDKPMFPLFLMLGIVLLLIPMQLIETANPDWRLIYSAGTWIAVIVTLLFFDQLGGKRWLYYFTPAVAMVLFAVPWVTQIENRVTAQLMGIVTAVTVEVVNLLGIYAVKMGSVIRMPESIVGIEEACSGVRSLQSSLMAGYLFGEILRFTPIRRLLLVFLGVALTFFLNLCRTIVLTLVTHYQGVTGYDKWHDNIGNLVAIIGFAGIAIIAWLMNRRVSATQTKNKDISSVSLETMPRLLTVKHAACLMGIVLASLGIDYLWYDQARNNESKDVQSKIQWEALAAEMVEIEINPITMAQLKYSVGNQYLWRGTRGSVWTVFYFKWNRGMISSHAGVHRPENCLPAAGMSLVKIHEDFFWEGPTGMKIPFRSMEFKGFGRKVIVFFSVWDEGEEQSWYSFTWRDRIQDVFKRRLVNGRHSLEFIVEGGSSVAEAKAQMLEYLEKMFST